MQKFQLCAPCLFGLEGLAADELRRLGIEDVRGENGRVRFSGTKEDIIKANICLGTAERVLIEMGHFAAITFEELFQGTKAIAWEDIIPADGEFPVKGHCLNSQLMSVPDCQRIIKKAVVDRMGSVYGYRRAPETGAKFQIQFSLMNDRVFIYLDTTGAGLHKRGWRAQGNAAPLRETLANGMIKLSRYRGRDRFYDPFCGSGTIAIEAALAAINRAPGINRRFAAMNWPGFDKKLWDDARQQARAKEFTGDYFIQASDIDPKCVELARHNAKLAGVEKYIRFKVADAREFSPEGSGIVVTNPPYGQRLMEQRSAETLYRQFGKAYFKLGDFKAYILSSHTEFERTFGRTADKKRKLYNGMIKCDLFMYLNNRLK